MSLINPVRGNVYTLTQVLTQLKLDDTPHLGFTIKLGEGYGKSIDSVLQTSHVMQSDLLTIEGFGDTRWKYLYTTSEWIPIFTFFNNPRPITDFVDFEEYIDPYDRQLSLWCTPKGFEREQYYYRDEHGDVRRTHDKKLHNEY